MSLKPSISLKSKVSGLKSGNLRRAPKRSRRAAQNTLDIRLQTSDSSPADLPFTFSNFAITADGKIAFANRKFVPFAGKRDQQHMMELRATADAVMSGARTVDLSPATLGPGGAKYRRQRIRRGLREYNLRIIVSGSGSIDPDAEIFKYNPLARSPHSREHPLPIGWGENSPNPDSRFEPLNRRPRSADFQVGSARADLEIGAPVHGEGRGEETRGTRAAASPIIVLTTQRISASSRRRLHNLGAEIKIFGKKEINFRAAFRWLRKKWNVKRLLCEGGGELHDAIIRAGLLNELHLTISPQIFGGRTAPTLADGIGFAKLPDAAQFKLKSARRVGDEIFLVYGRIG